MRTQKGFLSFILGNPLLLLSAGLGIALVVCGITGKVYKTQRDNARQEAEQVRNQFAGFRAETERLGKEAAEKAKAQEDKQRKVTNELQAKYRRDVARLNADLRRLREQPPVRPDGSEVPRVACPSPGVDGSGREQLLVGESEYRALEARAFQDAQRLTALQEWIRAVTR